MALINFITPERIFLELNASRHVGIEAAKCGTRALIVAESLLHQYGIIGKIEKILKDRGVSCIVYDEKQTYTSYFSVEEAVSLARGSHSDVIIGIGDQETLSIARTVSAIAGGHKLPEEYFQRPEELSKLEPLPYLEIFTFYRNPFLFSEELLLVGDDGKSPFFFQLPDLRAKSVMIDPLLMEEVSEKISAAAMIEILLYAIEALLSDKSHFFSDSQAYEAMRILFAVLDSNTGLMDHTVRKNITTAGLYASLCLSQTGLGPGSALAYTIGSQARLPKSSVAAVLLPYILESEVYSTKLKMSQVTEFIRGMVPGYDSESASDIIRLFLGRWKLPSRLRDIGLSEDAMPEAIETLASFYPGGEHYLEVMHLILHDAM